MQPQPQPWEATISSFSQEAVVAEGIHGGRECCRCPSAGRCHRASQNSGTDCCCCGKLQRCNNPGGRGPFPAGFSPAPGPAFPFPDVPALCVPVLSAQAPEVPVLTAAFASAGRSLLHRCRACRRVLLWNSSGPWAAQRCPAPALLSAFRSDRGCCPRKGALLQ